MKVTYLHNARSGSPSADAELNKDGGATSLQFALAARALSDAARALGLTAPGFRSPPRIADVDRSIQRFGSGASTVSVRLADRPFEAVLGDLVEGVVVANGLEGKEAMKLRSELWAAVVDHSPVAA